MTELEVLYRDISRLREVQRVAWTHLASPLLSPFERRQARNAIKGSSAELREYLQTLEAKLDKFRKQSPGDQDRRSSGKPQLRLLPEGY
jgi:hypothetical protein